MKECPKCKRGYGDEMHYCLTDGSYLSPVRDSEETVVASRSQRLQTTLAATPEIINRLNVKSEAPRPKVKYNLGLGATLLTVFGCAFGLLTLLFVASSLLRQRGLIEITMPQQSTSTPSPQPTPEERRYPVVNQSFYVAARGYSYFGFELHGQGRIVGGFSAQGGKNDIEVVLFDAEGYENFRNGQLASRVYYSSGGYVTSRPINKVLQAGKYVLVFNNRDAWITNKTVTAKVDILY